MRLKGCACAAIAAVAVSVDPALASAAEIHVALPHQIDVLPSSETVQGHFNMACSECCAR